MPFAIPSCIITKGGAVAAPQLPQLSPPSATAPAVVPASAAFPRQRPTAIPPAPGAALMKPTFAPRRSSGAALPTTAQRPSVEAPKAPVGAASAAPVLDLSDDKGALWYWGWVRRLAQDVAAAEPQVQLSNCPQVPAMDASIAPPPSREVAVLSSEENVDAKSGTPAGPTPADPVPQKTGKAPKKGGTAPATAKAKKAPAARKRKGKVVEEAPMPEPPAAAPSPVQFLPPVTPEVDAPASAPSVVPTSTSPAAVQKSEATSVAAPAPAKPAVNLSQSAASIDLLHEYNHVRDAAHAALAILAELHGLPVAELHRRRDVPELEGAS